MEKSAKSLVFQPGHSVSERQSRKLQRNIGRFHNADVEERLAMVASAEELLNILLKDDELDASAICKLVCRCAAWLHAPVSLNPGHKDAVAVVAGHGPNIGGDLQHRIRRILIRALRSLELEDAATYKLVEAALIYISQSLEKVDFDPNGVNNLSNTAKQWYRLQSLLRLLPENESSKVAETSGKKLRPHHVKRAEMAVSVEGAYHPSKKMKSLESIFCSEQVVQLKCSQCTATMTSSWFWRHPLSGRVQVLVPAHGHSPCNKRRGKRTPWRAQGFPMCVDNFYSLDFCHLELRHQFLGDRPWICHHQRQRQRCRACGGRSICVHSRRRDTCKLCSRAGEQKRAKKNGKPPGLIPNWSH
eukprot:Skav206716  [mRNA]  locus=scaffold967:28738:30653:- [translate_table: standard]